MSCLCPIKISPESYRGTSKERSSFYVNCRKCPPCRAKQAREWTKRMKDELTLHPYASFLTLTYAPECLPAGGNLCYSDVQLFLKRLRIALDRDKAIPIKKIRYFVCCEYGPTGTHRPHYHLIIFGLNPGIDDTTMSNFSSSPQHVAIASLVGSPAYYRERSSQWHATTELVKKAWGKGIVEVDSVNDSAIGYVANYLQKKDYYAPKGKVQPFHRQSTNPGIGYGYAKRIANQIVDKGAYTVIKHSSMFSPTPGNKSYPLDLPFPNYYYRKFLTDEQKEQRRKDMIVKSIEMYSTPEEIEYLKLKTVDELQDLVAERKLRIQHGRDSQAQAKQRLFGDSNSRQKLDYHEQVFGIPAGGNGLDLPSALSTDKKPEKDVILTKKQKRDLIPKIQEVFPNLDLKLDTDTEDLTWSEREALDKVRRSAKVKSRQN